MNERIKEIAEQSGVTVLTTRGMENVVDGCYIIGPAHLQKFAELIVRECAQFVEDKFDFIGDEIIVKEKMLEHFGVEE